MKDSENRLGNYFENLPKRLLDQTENKKIVSAYTYGALAGIATVMTVINIVSQKGWLILVTGVFAIVCLLNLLLNRLSQRGEKFAAGMFSIEVLALFTYFLISGEPQGFSAIWICMLPFVGMLFYDKLRGTVLSLIMLAILIFLLWTPWGNGFLLHPEYYTSVFKWRFPILFISYYFVALFLESLRSFTQDELSKLNNVYLELAIRDQLTQMYNRKGLFDKIEEHIREKGYRKIGIVIFDIDYFKGVNDTYGHLIGDEILKNLAKLMKQSFNAYLCRWGGEEFSMVYFDDNVKSTDIEKFLSTLEAKTFVYGDTNLNITMSAGVYETSDHNLTSFNEWVKKADDALYQAKEQGRNRVIYY